ncbi:MAG: AAA family ATPase [Betaproteobacteria bacterium]|nr:AAA family ATPase [Betaproteobacteria bacterium]
MKISRLEMENVKRVQAVQIEPSPNGLTVIGGRNSQGKTSVLDGICWALGGNKHKPSDPKRRDSAADPRIHIEMDNGLVVTREGKNASLKVIDPFGNKAGQTLLDDLIGQLAINLPAFLQAGVREKAETLLQVIGVGDQLSVIDREIETTYNERHMVGQAHARKQKHAEDLPFEQGAPDTEVSAGELIQRQQAILTKNGENQRLRLKREELSRAVQSQQAAVDSLANQLRIAQENLSTMRADYAIATRTAESLADESTAELEASLRQIDEINRRVRVNAEKRRAEEEAAALEAQVNELTTKLEAARARRMQLLAGTKLPLHGLSIEAGELTYNGQRWDCMSGSDQLRVGVAIVRQLRPDCQFVLLDKLEQMDLQTLQEFGAWLEAEDLQAIATRVSTGSECSIIIEDGLVAGASLPIAPSIPLDSEGF